MSLCPTQVLWAAMGFPELLEEIYARWSMVEWEGDIPWVAEGGDLLGVGISGLGTCSGS